MKHNIIKGLIISAVFVFGIQLIATGTISKYNKSIPLSGVLTTFLPQETNNTDWKIHKFYSGSSATVNDDDSVLSKGRIDAVKTLYCGSNGYEVSIDMPATGTANGFGFYVDGLYNDDTEVYNGLSIQYNGSYNMITRSFDFSEQSGSYGNESWVGGLISFDDLYKQIDQNSLRKAHNIKVRLEPQEDTDKWLLTLFVNGTEIDFESNILVQPIHQGEYVTVGYRTWAVNGQNTFSNLMVTPLEASNEEATPRDLLQYLADELYTSGSTVYEYFETRTKKGKTLDSTGYNHAPIINEEIITKGLVRDDADFAWRIWNCGPNNGYNIFLTYEDITDMDSGEILDTVYRVNTKTKTIEVGTASVLRKTVSDGEINIIDGETFNLTESLGSSIVVN